MLAYLERTKRHGRAGRPPSDLKADALATATHPEVAVQVWTKVTSGLPVDCRWVAAGTLALVHPPSGIIFAVAIGTSYCLRLTPPDKQKAMAAGGKTTMRWSSGKATDVEEALGADWVVGRYLADEPEWLRSEYAALDE